MPANARQPERIPFERLLWAALGGACDRDDADCTGCNDFRTTPAFGVAVIGQKLRGRSKSVT
jgi:hypothetical protein